MSSKAIEKIVSGKCSRADFLAIRNNALRIQKESSNSKWKTEAAQIIQACDAYSPEPLSRYYNFMGFCPGADFTRREDERWKAEGICDFSFFESKSQMETFSELLPGDWIILKKREKFGKTMKLYGFGKIERRVKDDYDTISYKVKWNDQANVIEVPLMGCNSTVNIRALEAVEKEMAKEFWEWLGKPFED